MISTRKCAERGTEFGQADFDVDVEGRRRLCKGTPSMGCFGAHQTLASALGFPPPLREQHRASGIAAMPPRRKRGPIADLREVAAVRVCHPFTPAQCAAHPSVRAANSHRPVRAPTGPKGHGRAASRPAGRGHAPEHERPRCSPPHQPHQARAGDGAAGGREGLLLGHEGAQEGRQVFPPLCLPLPGLR